MAQIVSKSLPEQVGCNLKNRRPVMPPSSLLIITVAERGWTYAPGVL